MSTPLNIPGQGVGQLGQLGQLGQSDHHGAALLSPESPGRLFQLPSPIITRRTRTESTSERALENPIEEGTVKYFSRIKGHGFIVPSNAGEDIFVHISDIEGEYVPRVGDQVTYRLCPIPPKNQKWQAVHVQISNFTPDVHQKWDCPVKPDEDDHK